MRRLQTSLALIALTATAWSAPLAAQALEDFHNQRAEGGRWCMSDHFHTGSSGGEASRAAAERAAVSSWSSFTALEYGDHWGSWRIAASRRMRCAQPTGTWGCQAEARPCRPLVGGGVNRPRAKARPKAKAAAKQ